MAFKLNSVETYHQFLNKTLAIAEQDRGSRDIFIQSAKIYHYACNSYPINDTDMVHSVAAVGKEFRFPMNTELLPTPTLNPDNNQLFFKYL